MLRWGCVRRLLFPITDARFSKKILQNVPQHVSRWTPCQEKVFDVLRDPALGPGSRDVLLRSQTGSGKTLAYLIPLLDKLVADQALPADQTGNSRPEEESSNKCVLVVVPTRELVYQVSSVARQLVRGSGVSVEGLCGHPRQLLPDNVGESNGVADSGCGARVVVCTPGGLLGSPINSRILASQVVIDEFDRLMDFGFIGQLEQIFVSHVSRDAQLMLASATCSGEVEILAKRLLRPNFAFVDTALVAPASLQHSVVEIENAIQFFPTLMGELHKRVGKRGIVVFPTTRSLLFFYSVAKLDRNSVHRLLVLHGRMSHDKRREIYDRFSSLTSRENFTKNDDLAPFKRGAEEYGVCAGGSEECGGGVLFTTDVAARGLDFPNIDFVVHVGFSGDQNPAHQYIHRSGRTARNGGVGESVLFLIGGLDRDSRVVDELRALVPLATTTSTASSEIDTASPNTKAATPILDEESVRGNEMMHAKSQLGNGRGYLRHLSTKCLESLLSFHLERCRDRLTAPRPVVAKALIDMVRSAGLSQPFVSESLAARLKLDTVPGLLLLRPDKRKQRKQQA